MTALDRMVANAGASLLDLVRFAPRVSRHPYPDARPRDRDDRSLANRAALVLDQVAHGHDLLVRAQPRESDDARMWEPSHDDQRAEVLVSRDEHAVFAERQREQVFVGGLSVSVQSGQDIMAIVDERLL